jgi:regulator of RNase E activity RraA
MDTSWTRKSIRLNEPGRKLHLLFTSLAALAALAVAITATAASRIHAATRAQSPSGRSAPAGTAASAQDSAALLDAFRHVEVASVSDAIEQLIGRRMYLSHRFRPLFTSRFTGYALTVHLQKEENRDPHALDGMLAAIDHGERNSVYVMSIQDGADLAGIGGLMGTAMQARDFSGAVIDGAVRDTAYLTKIGFPVYSTGIAPSTLVGHYRCTGNNVPVVIDGIAIHPGDIITADSDGVVVVPKSRAAAILVLAQQLDFKEHSMYPLIEKNKSIEDAVKQFGRL